MYLRIGAALTTMSFWKTTPAVKCGALIRIISAAGIILLVLDYGDLREHRSCGSRHSLLDLVDQ